MTESRKLSLQRLLEAVEPLGPKGPAAVARELNVSDQTINNWKSRGVPHAKAVEAQTRWGISAHWITTGEGEQRVAAASAREESNITEGPAIRGLYPLISEVQAGMWTELCDNFATGDAEDWLPSTKNLGECGYMLRVRGKSMEVPGARVSFAEGMVLHVKAPADPQPGDFVIVRREGTDQATFKKYVVIDGHPYLEAINPDWPKELKYLPMQPGDVWCGVVVDASLGGLSRI